MRIAFRMKVNPGQEAEYIARHNPIWPELETLLHEQGVCNYSIFFDATTSDLFAYAEVEDLERWKAVAQTEICQKWWKHMAPLMPSNADLSPIATDLREIFHIGRDA